jgi:lipoprotein-releasing system permease protein
VNTSVYIAKRYLFSRKTTNAINIISGISMLGVFVGTAALIIILSVFNGFEKVIISLYSNFTPQIKIEPRIGKTFDPHTAYFNQLQQNPSLFSYTEVLQERALVRYGNRQVISTIKGVSNSFLKNKSLDSTILNGSFTLLSQGRPLAVIGSAVQASLGININDQLSNLAVYAPRRNATNSVNPLNEFVVKNIQPSGIFSIQQDFDDIVVTPISFARDLLDQPQQVSSIELNFNDGADVNSIQAEIIKKAGIAFTVKNRYQQNTALYKILNMEKWAVFLILTFVLIIAIFNIIGSLTMLVIDKRKDIAILSSLGAGSKLVQRIFFIEGMLISTVGCAAGVLAGFIFCLVQQQFGLIKMGGQVSTIDAYPVAFKITDFILVLATVLVISVIASGISARLSIKGLDEVKQNL